MVQQIISHIQSVLSSLDWEGEFLDFELVEAAMQPLQFLQVSGAYAHIEYVIHTHISIILHGGDIAHHLQSILEEVLIQYLHSEHHLSIAADIAAQVATDVANNSAILEQISHMVESHGLA